MIEIPLDTIDIGWLLDRFDDDQSKGQKRDDYHFKEFNYFFTTRDGNFFHSLVSKQLDKNSPLNLYPTHLIDSLCETLGFNKLMAMLFDRKKGVAPIDNLGKITGNYWVQSIVSYACKNAGITLNLKQDYQAGQAGIRLLCTVFCQQEALGHINGDDNLKHVDAHGKTFLHHLVESQFTDESAKVTFFKRYFVYGIDDPNKLKTIAAKDINGNTPLHLAVKARYYELVALFLQYGAAPYEPNNQGEEPYSMAKSDSQYDKEQCALLNPDHYKIKELNDVFDAIGHKDVSRLRALLVTGIQINRFHPHRKINPLHHVCLQQTDTPYRGEACNVEMAKLLILHGADPSLPELNLPFSSAIHVAKDKQNPEFFDGVAEAFEMAKKQRDEQAQLRQREAVELSERKSAVHQNEQLVHLMAALTTQTEQSQLAQVALNTAVTQLPGQLIAAAREEEQRKKEEKKQKSKDRRNKLKFWKYIWTV